MTPDSKDKVLKELSYLKGMEFHWEPTKRHASVWCRITDILITDDGELWIESVEINSLGVEIAGRKFTNEMTRFVEAVSFNSNNQP